VKKEKIYPESGVELSPFISKHYDGILTLASFGYFPRTIRKAIGDMNVRPEDRILDLGCGTGSNDYLMSGYMNENGSILGMDISSEMQARFQKRFRSDERVRFLEQRVDQPFQLGESFDKVLISFVIHGFPHEVRQGVIENAKNHLKTGGSFFILDFAEFDMASMPAVHRKIFKTVECRYAFDFIERDWKTILAQHGFGDFREHFYLKRYMRLLEAVLK
jgi:demethylmenaquinone methyltransferase/2-methoxy-6-polyprenyl-1,4-benzoquinol methylase